MTDIATAAYEGTLLGSVEGKVRASPRARRGVGAALWIALGAALVAPSIQFVSTIREVDVSVFREGGTRHRTALGRWLPTAEELSKGAAGENPYGYGHWFPTPPMVLLFLVPLAKIGYVPAGIVWAALKVIGFVGAMALLLRALARSGIRVPIGVIAIAGVFSIRPIVSDFKHGNLNIFMMVWLALALACYLRKREAWSGLFLALAIVTKITPALALVYFAYKRRWRVFAWAGAGLVLVFFVVPGALLGWERNWVYLRTWFDMLVRPFAVEGYAALEIANQSLYGVALRLLSNAKLLAIQTMPGDQAIASGMESMARPAGAAGALLRPAISLCVLAVMAAACRRRERSPLRDCLEFALVLTAMLLLSERTWKHHATTLPIVYVGLWYAVACEPRTDRFRGWMVGLLAVQFVLLVVLSEEVLGERLADRMLDGGFFCWGLVGAFAQIAVLLAKTPARGPGFSERSP